MISQAFLNRYRKEVDQASKEAGEYVRIALQTYRQQNPQATVAETRNYVINLVNDSLSIFGGQSALIANDFFDELAREAGEEATAYMFDTVNYDAVRESVHYQAGKLVEDKADEFMDRITSLSEYHVKREAFENLRLNCNKRGLAYARVPSGRDTCAFCFILASRGFVYHSKESAGGVKGHEYHTHCDCVIVPSYGSGLDEDSQIEGYQPSHLRKRYHQCVDAIQESLTEERYKKSGSKLSFKDWKSEQIRKEIATRDFKWLYRSDYTCKLIEDPEWNDNEVKTATLLRDQGFNVVYNERSLQHNDRRADFNLNGIAYEMKNPTGNGYLCVYNQFKKAVLGNAYLTNPQSDKLVISNVGNDISYEILIEKIKKVYDEGAFPEIIEVIAVDRTGKISRLKR